MDAAEKPRNGHGMWLSTALAVVLGVIGAVLLITQAGSSGESAPNPSSSSTSTTTVTPATAAPSTTTAVTTTTTIMASRSTTTVSASTTTTVPVPATALTTTTVPPPPTTVLVNRVPVWPPYQPLGAVTGVAALTGAPVDATTAARPILAVKIDNFRSGRPQWGLDIADVIIEENVEGITRFVALFHSQVPDEVGPVRSARTGDLDLLAAMNRPILGWSGGNPGVTDWVESADNSGILVDFSAQHEPCYRRTSSRPGPHNLLLDPACALAEATFAGPAIPLWSIDDDWVPADTFSTTADTTFDVEMDGVRVEWTWDAETGTYLRSQDGIDHVAVSGARIAANNVVEISSFHARSPVDGRSPNPITVGGTDVIVHRDGVAIAGTWYRETEYEPFAFYDAATGAGIPLDAGKTFVELVRDR